MVTINTNIITKLQQQLTTNNSSKTTTTNCNDNYKQQRQQQEQLHNNNLKNNNKQQQTTTNNNKQLQTTTQTTTKQTNQQPHITSFRTSSLDLRAEALLRSSAAILWPLSRLCASFSASLVTRFSDDSREAMVKNNNKKTELQTVLFLLFLLLQLLRLFAYHSLPCSLNYSAVKMVKTRPSTRVLLQR